MGPVRLSKVDAKADKCTCAAHVRKFASHADGQGCTSMRVSQPPDVQLYRLVAVQMRMSAVAKATKHAGMYARRRRASAHDVAQALLWALCFYVRGIRRAHQIDRSGIALDRSGFCCM